jgi:hypothetical protein
MDICDICQIECLHSTTITNDICFLCDGKCLHLIENIVCEQIIEELIIETPDRKSVV